MATHDFTNTHGLTLFGMQKPFISEVVPTQEHTGLAWWFAFHRNRLLVEVSAEALRVPCRERVEELGVTVVQRHYLGRYDGLPCHAVDLADASLPEGMDFKDLRQVYGLLEEDLFVLGGRAVQIVEWDRTHQYCGRCGSRTHTKEKERAKVCPQCGLYSFPRLSPAIIVAVERGDEILLARSAHFPQGMFSVLAGFVEPGETLEECVVREVNEEVGITVGNIRYCGSQPWPFPNSLMLGFTAEYVAGELTLDPTEIAEAGWFRADSLPTIPGRMSIAGRLITSFLNKVRPPR
ncbi:MAG: NAD(+) diphosphatase [Candidatus Binatia bacterium]